MGKNIKKEKKIKKTQCLNPTKNRKKQTKRNHIIVVSQKPINPKTNKKIFFVLFFQKPKTVFLNFTRNTEKTKKQHYLNQKTTKNNPPPTTKPPHHNQKKTTGGGNSSEYLRAGALRNVRAWTMRKPVGFSPVVRCPTPRLHQGSISTTLRTHKIKKEGAQRDARGMTVEALVKEFTREFENWN